LILCYDRVKAQGLSKFGFCAALDSEGLVLENTYAPVYRNPLLNLYDQTSPLLFRDQKEFQDYKNLRLPNTEKAFEETALLINHASLLGSKKYVDQLLMAIEKVSGNLGTAKDMWDAKEIKPRR
jgi:hypothetical protein